MPPGAAKKTKSALKGSNRRGAAPDDAAEEEDIVGPIRKALILAFRKAQQSTSTHASQRRIVTKHLDEHREETLQLLAAICVKTLSMQQSADVSRRHALFLADFCNTMLKERSDDSVAARILASVLPYNGAKDKTVRFAVTCMVEPLLRALSPDVESDERTDLFDSIVEAMKYRVFDNFYAVRERAVAALQIFQEGKKDCDATQHILIAACEDVNPNVRRTAAAAAVPKEAYFGALSRMIRDVSPIVRKAAWDSLAKYKFTHVVAFCTLHKLVFIDFVYTGFTDTAVPVQLACSHAVGKWLVRDEGNDPVKLLGRVPLPATETPAVTALARTLLQAAIRHRGASDSPLVFQLEVEGLTPANCVMWRVSCEAAVRSGDGTEATVLPPLLDFSAILKDAIDTFIKQDEAECKVVKFVNPEYADQVLRIFLSVIPLYDEGGYLNHIDDQSRTVLIRNMSTLLKVVTEGDPGLFARDIMQAFALIGARHPAQVDTAVNDVLQLLFRTLTLPRQEHIGYDDIEHFGKKDYDRRVELRQLQTSGQNPTRAEALAAAIETDTLYLVRMMHIVLQNLTFRKRGDSVPAVCGHFIQLGRAQCDPEVRALAVKAMGLQCLLSPQTVHTFLPLLLVDAEPPADGVSTMQHTPSSEAALCVLFDLLTEYPPSFFNAGEGQSYAVSKANEARIQQGVADDAENAERDELREHAVAAIAGEDSAKVGAGRVLSVCRTALLSDFVVLRRVAMRGYCKLLACGRLSPSQSVDALALVFVNLFTFEAAAALRGPRADVVGAFLYGQLDFFISSFAASDPRRMRIVCDAGLLAGRMICHRQHQDVAPLPAARLIRRLLFYTDAALLKAVRDVDPDFANAAFEDHQQADADQAAAAAAAAAAADEDADTSAARRSAGASSVMSRGGTRVGRLLATHSQHEYLAFELLLTIANEAEIPGAQRWAASALRSLRMYDAQSQRARSLAEAIAAAKSKTDLADVTEVLEEFEIALDSLRSTTREQNGSVPASDNDEAEPRRSSVLSTAAESHIATAAARYEKVTAALQGIGEHLIAIVEPVNTGRGRRTRGSTNTAGRPSKEHRTEVSDASPGQQDTETSQDILNLPTRGGRKRR